MALTKKQQELDIIKWQKSEEMGIDACGSFDYCAYCDKALENPCDKAFKKLAKANKPATEKKTCAKRTCAKKTCKK